MKTLQLSPTLYRREQEKFLLRPASSADAPALAELKCAVWPDEESDPRHMAGVLTAEDHLTVVAETAGRLVLRRYGMEGAKLLIGVAVRQWKNLSQYKRQMAEAADELIRRYQARIVFLPMQIPDDVMVSRSILQQMQEQKSAAILSERFSTTEFLSIVGNLDLLIGIRLHALIFGAVMQVPVIGLSYDPKIERFLASIGEQPVTDLESVTAQSVLEKVASFWPEEGERVNPQLAYTSRLREQAFYNAELALALLERKKRR